MIQIFLMTHICSSNQDFDTCLAMRTLNQTCLAIRTLIQAECLAIKTLIHTYNGYKGDILMYVQMMHLVSKFQISRLFRHTFSSLFVKKITCVLGSCYLHCNETSLTLVLLNPDMPCLFKQCRRSQLICICTVCH